LFGYEKGAFSGAREQGKPGLFELAHEGTLFLDEIGELPFSVQAKLLKYLDDHKVQRLGGIKAKSIDCIIIAASP
jgi:transcriptional regulator with PAS, ATPase and Fis domain